MLKVISRVTLADVVLASPAIARDSAMADAFYAAAKKKENSKGSK